MPLAMADSHPIESSVSLQGGMLCLSGEMVSDHVSMVLSMNSWSMVPSVRLRANAGTTKWHVVYSSRVKSATVNPSAQPTKVRILHLPQGPDQHLRSGP